MSYILARWSIYSEALLSHFSILDSLFSSPDTQFMLQQLKTGQAFTTPPQLTHKCVSEKKLTVVKAAEFWNGLLYSIT